MKKLQDMYPDEFIKMFNDLGYGDRIKGKKIEAAQAHHPDRKETYGFGYKKPSGYLSQVWEFKDLVKNVRICDWLDYYGFERPKWRP
jgi:hypothetical protein